MNEFEGKSLFWNKVTAWASIGMAFYAWQAFENSATTNKATLARLDSTLQRMDLEREQAIRPHVSFHARDYNITLGPYNRVQNMRDEDGHPIAFIYARNAGAGAAVNTEVVWNAERLWTTASGDNPDPSFVGLTERWAFDPTMVLPGEACGIFALPEYLMRDHQTKRVKALSGTIQISCTDTNGKAYKSTHDFGLSVNYHSKPATAVLRVKPARSPDFYTGSPAF